MADAYVTEPTSFLSLRGKKVDATLASNFFLFLMREAFKLFDRVNSYYSQAPQFSQIAKHSVR